MLPEKRKLDDDGVNGRGGFEVHVIGGGRPVPSDGGGRGLERGLRIGVGNAKESGKPRSPGDLVHRLEAEVDEDRLPARPMSDVGPAEPQVSGGRRKRRRGLGHWTVWMAVATCGVAVAAVGGLLFVDQRQAGKLDHQADYVFESVQTLDQDQRYFLEQSGELIEEAQGLLERYAAASSVGQVLPLVRDPEHVKERMSLYWQPWGTETLFAPGEQIDSYIIDGAGRPGITLAGRKGDFSRFEMTFVREGEQMKLDWEASQGIGEVQIEELQRGSPGDGGVVRAVVSPSTFHTAEFPEKDFRSYQLSDASGDHFIWAFAPLGSPVAAAFEAEFNEGSVLLEKSAEVRATVRLARSGSGSGKCYKITEMLHKGWVTP